MKTGAEIIRDCGDSASRWADEFMACVRLEGLRPDHATMLGWFANAIESRPKPRLELSGSEAINGFVAWLSTRSEEITIGASRDCAPLVELIQLFCNINELSPPRNCYSDLLKYPKSALNPENPGYVALLRAHEKR